MAKKRKRPRHWWVKERIVRGEAAKSEAARLARDQRVYGRAAEPAPPEQPSESVRAMSNGFESSRRRH
ncbi:hypothetical protein HUT19_40740 [Streptomyces sp. NA02950]|uniref:hypothetical protein n=1 Tax=Streptomyces sp. NA02950 TaxID=2742137 RepID=UPI0015903D79|nr:hypothetical protein [Streptomyces sp. NA02950]QKV97217.1 hypothetical protein HUT19_40740 [Streptomyces sp. NA02950]